MQIQTGCINIVLQLAIQTNRYFIYILILKNAINRLHWFISKHNVCTYYTIFKPKPRFSLKKF